MIEGHFIVIEGIDGAGTTTQGDLLATSLAERGLPVHTTREPSDGPIGTMIRQILTGRLVVPGRAGGRPPGWPTMAALFAADRLDHLEAEVLPNLMDGVTVISDRYDYSSVAYQTVRGGGDPEIATWVRELNCRARRPDLTLVLDVDPDVAAKRRDVRSGSPELYEQESLQRDLASFYSKIETMFPNDRIVHVDANQPMDTVSAAIASQVALLRGDATA